MGFKRKINYRTELKAKWTIIPGQPSSYKGKYEFTVFLLFNFSVMKSYLIDKMPFLIIILLT